ncbi:MAG: hypothetical protein E7206_04935 [Clostridium beijerinckii]|nr:hypothetical protein [Clostridium beijerinckii]
MKDKDCLDKVIKCAIDDSIFDIKASRDIFNEAWNNKEKEMGKKKYFSIKNIRKEALVPICCALFAIVGVFTFSPGARAAAQEALKIIFLLDKSGNIIERSEDEAVDDVTVGGFEITDKNKNEIEGKFGFEFNFPEKVGNFSITEIAGYPVSPVAMMTVKDLKYKDEENSLDKFRKAVGDDQIFNELSKDYKIIRNICESYEDSEKHKFFIYLSKFSEDSEMNSVKETTIDNIKCRVLEENRAKYERSENGDDVTKKPISVNKIYYMVWDYNGVSYRIYIGENSANIDVATQFAKDYIKILKQE